MKKYRSIQVSLLLAAVCAIGLSSATASASTAEEEWREEFAYTLGVQAYIYGFPWIFLPQIRWEYVTQPTDPAYVPYAALNQFWNARYLMNASNRSGGSPQSDTLYSMCWANLSDEPLILSVPAIADRYYSFEFASMDSDNFALISTRTTGTNAGTYAIIGPDWTGSLPTGVTELAHSRTPYAFIVGRTLVFNADDVANVNAIQDQYKLIPLSCLGTTNLPPADHNVWAPYSTNDPLGCWKTMNRAMTENPPNVSNQQSFVDYISQIGLGPDQDVEATDAATRRGLARAAQDGMAVMMEFNQTGGYGLETNGWYYPPATMGRCGQSNDFLSRAASQCYVGIVASDTAEAVYLNAPYDAQGFALRGVNNYIIRFPAGGLPDVNAFWSVTMYGMDHNFVVNPLNRYKFGTYPVGALRPDPDGSYPIYVQNASPGADKESNWLPAPIGQFYLLMRTYWPGSNIVNRTWAPPAITPVLHATASGVSADYNGDGIADPAVYSNGYWSIYSLTNGIILNNAGPWGGSGSILVPGDYDGDGIADPVVYLNGYWSIYSLVNGIILNNAGPWGGSGSIPVPGDYDGDGKSDPAVYLNGYWSIYSLANGIILNNSGPWGGPGWTTVPGDYDGDGRSDLAVYLAGYWSICSLTNGIILNNEGFWGGSGSIPVPGDYDGDRKSDLAVYNNGYWSIYSLTNGIILNNVGPWGGSGSIPVPGDYDGDGKSDLAVYDSGYWSIYSLTNGIILNNSGPWGGPGWTPVR
jgi:hypothetical protein